MQLIVMPVLCGVQMTRTCLASCQAQDLEDVTVLAIDNGSRDGVGPWLRAQRERVIVQSYAKPKGLSYVWNSCLRWAFGSLGLDHVLVINNDLKLRPDTYRLLLADGGGFVTGVSVDRPEQTQHANPESKSPHPSFSCFLIRREVWEKVGPFDESLAVYASDGDYHLRMDQAGIEAYAIDLPFLHEVSGTLKNVPDAQREAICQQADADRAAFERKWGFAIGSPEYYAEFSKPRENRYASTGRLA